MTNEKAGNKNDSQQAELLKVPDTSVPVEYVEKKMQEYFQTSSQFGPNLKMSHIGIGEVNFAFFIKVLLCIKKIFTPLLLFNSVKLSEVCTEKANQISSTCNNPILKMSENKTFYSLQYLNITLLS